MTDKPDDGKVVELAPVREAFEKAQPRARKTPDKPKVVASGGGRGGGDGGKPPPPTTPRYQPRHWQLPPDSPVKALGFNGLDYHFLARSGQRVTLAAKEIRGPVIIALFGEESYLIEHWPSFDKNGDPTGEFKHARLPGVLISTAQLSGLWDPADKERGVGCWAEDDGTLVFHCGDILVTSKGRVGTGVRGRLLYPSAPALPEPILKAGPGAKAAFATPTWGPKEWAEVEGPGARVMERLVTWNFSRPHVDAMLSLGWIAAALLGAAPDWRPMWFLTGDSRTGKSTLLKYIKWLLGHDAFVSSGNSTQAAIARKVKNSTKPVVLDELERNADNDRAEKIIELMVLASSGETLDRGTPGAETNSFTARNCFLVSAVSPPPLRPQDMNRLLIVELGALEGHAPPDADEDEIEGEDHVDRLLGARSVVERVGQELRGRLVMGWDRYHRTFRGYHKALLKQGHDRRGADQFGALLTAYDLVMFDLQDLHRTEAFAEMLPARKMTETSGTVSNHEACLQHLLSSTPLLIRGGSNETVAHWLRQAQGDARAGKPEESSDALRAMAKTGIKLFRDKRFLVSGNEEPRWMLALSNECDGMARVFQGTKWSKGSGSTAGWPQMFKRLDGAETHGSNGEKLRIRIDGWRQYVTYVPLLTVFPARDAAGADAAETETIDIRDRS